MCFQLLLDGYGYMSMGWAIERLADLVGVSQVSSTTLGCGEEADSQVKGRWAPPKRPGIDWFRWRLL